MREMKTVEAGSIQQLQRSTRWMRRHNEHEEDGRGEMPWGRPRPFGIRLMAELDRIRTTKTTIEKVSGENSERNHRLNLKLNG